MTIADCVDQNEFISVLVRHSGSKVIEMLSEHIPLHVRPAFVWSEFDTLDAAIADGKQALMAQISGEEIEMISG